ncbi:kallikrein 1-related peptidase b9-like [Cimex lectularius]|uniref:Peptidase S1 domain-containing protein n=1 Tax=Cimex lectularius TaxID=79782 RepID=A0A8I6SNE1_CIMLE|nr:kallikrein 1-related peptidase b9-like [Cimex lectularius]
MFCSGLVKSAEYEKKIIRRRAHQGEFPYIVCIRSKYYKCGGVLVKLNNALTAASCFQLKNERDRKTLVAIGGTVHLQDRTGQEIVISSFIKHEKFLYIENNNIVETHYDIGLATLLYSFEENPNLQPYGSFPFETAEEMKTYLLDIANQGRRCVTVGYGFLTKKLAEAPYLHVVEVNILLNDSCNKVENKTDPVICTKAVRKETNTTGNYANNGKGNPLICNGKILGIDRGFSIEEDRVIIIFTPIWPYLNYFKLPLAISSGNVSVQSVVLQASLLTLAVIYVVRQ